MSLIAARLRGGDVVGEAGIFGDDVLGLISVDRGKLVLTLLPLLGSTFSILFFFRLFQDVADVKKFSFLVIGLDIITAVSQATLYTFGTREILKAK